MVDSKALNLFEETRLLPDGEAKLELLEEVIMLADKQRHTDLAYAAREALMDSASFGGYPEKTLQTFSKQLAEFDKNPEQFESYPLLWRFKWALHHLRDFPNIDTDEIERMLSDFKRRLKQENYSLRPLYYQQLMFALQAGRLDKAKGLFKAWQTSPRDDLADCLACERHQKVLYYLALIKLDKALSLAKPLLEQELSCHSVPQNTYAVLIRAHLEAGQLKEAKRLHDLNYSSLKRSPQLAELGHHLMFLSLSGDLVEALNLVAFHLPKLCSTRALEAKFYFLLGLAAFCSQMLAANNNLSLSLPPDITYAHTVQGLSDWCKKELEQLVKQFDARNQTKAFETRLERNNLLIKTFIERKPDA